MASSLSKTLLLAALALLAVAAMAFSPAAADAHRRALFESELDPQTGCRCPREFRVTHADLQGAHQIGLDAVAFFCRVNIEELHSLNEKHLHDLGAGFRLGDKVVVPEICDED